MKVVKVVKGEDEQIRVGKIQVNFKRCAICGSSTSHHLTSPHVTTTAKCRLIAPSALRGVSGLDNSQRDKEIDEMDGRPARGCDRRHRV